MPRKAYTPAERALHIIGALAGKTVGEINDAIATGDHRTWTPDERRKALPQASLDMLVNRYAVSHTAPGGPIDTEVWERLWAHCLGPVLVAELPD